MEDKIRTFSDYELYNLFFDLRAWAREQAENTLTSSNMEPDHRLLEARRHYYYMAVLIQIEAEMKARSLKLS